MNNLSEKFPRLLRSIKEKNIKFEFILIEDKFIYGYEGTQSTIVKETLYSNKFNKISQYLKTQHFTEVPIIVPTEIYNQVNKCLQSLCFPYDVTEETIYYKIYNEGLDDSVSYSQDEEKEILSFDFNIDKLVKLKNSIKFLVDEGDIESVISFLLISEKQSHLNTTIKSLIKLSFQFYMKEEYEKVLEILEDIFALFNQEEYHDKDLFFKMKQLKETVQQKLISFNS